MNDFSIFNNDRSQEIQKMGADTELHKKTSSWLLAANTLKYSYHFDWLGLPIIQYPQDIVAMQELIWAIRPDLIIETGIARGGSLACSASILALMDMSDAIKADTSLDPKKSNRMVLGVDIDIRQHNRIAIESHPMASRIKMIQGSSIDPDIVSQVHSIAKDYKTILVFLDSNHTHEHVLAELEAYAPLVSSGSYCVVFDTVIEDMPESMFPDRPWGPGNNPKTAVWEYLKSNPQFEINKDIPNKLQITVAPDGFLRRR